MRPARLPNSLCFHSKHRSRRPNLGGERNPCDTKKPHPWKLPKTHSASGPQVPLTSHELLGMSYNDIPNFRSGLLMPAHPLSSQFVREAVCPRGRAKVDFSTPDRKASCSKSVLPVARRTISGMSIRTVGSGSSDRPRRCLSLEQARRLGRTAAANVCLVPILRPAVRNCGPSRRSSSLSVIGICPMPRRTSEAGTSTK